MSGEKNLERLLSAMSPELLPGGFVFCTFADAGYGSHSHLHPMAAIKEAEGLTLIIPAELAKQHQISDESVFSCITLNIHSSLDAVGLTAAVSNRLAEHNISANVIAGYYHDHIFVPSERSDQALQLLQAFDSQQ